MAHYTGCKKIYFITSSAPFTVLKDPAEKLMKQSQINFKSCLHNADSKSNFFLSEQLLKGFEKIIVFTLS